MQSDGTIFFPYVGVVDVAGKTLEQIRQVLTERIKTYINNPQLDVRVAAFRSQKVQVMGEVTKPSVLPITDIPLTALDAINQVGGATKDADLEHVTLTRNGHVSTLNIQALYDYGDMTQNILLQNGDILQVSDKSLNQVFILGEVQKPASYLMNKGRMSLAEAVGATGGFNETTVNPSRIYVIRGEYDKPKIYRLDASSPDALLLATQFPLKPKDVVYVASTDIARWNRIIQQILPTIQTLWQTKVLTQ